MTDSVSQRPVANAAVRLYLYKTRSADPGCFVLGGADAMPFEFGVEAPGYKPVVIKAVPGWLEATVSLVPDRTAGQSSIATRAISQERYAELSRQCR